MTTGNRLIYFRTIHNYSQAYVADAVGINKSTYYRMENDQSSVSVEMLTKLLRLYDISFEEFTGLCFPIVKTISYPKAYVDRLKRVLDKNESLSDNLEKRKKQLSEIHDALDPLLDSKIDQMVIPEYNDNILSETTIATFKFDVEVEKLINKAFNMYMEITS